MKVKVRIARLSVISNTVLIIMKLAVGLISGSVSIISEAIHSTMDLLAAIIAFFTVRVSDTPPDAKHPYGHGKYENISGVIEAILIFIAAVWIVFEAIKKIIHPGEIESIGFGSLVMFISAIINTLVSRQLYKVARKTNSLALEADALHLKTDVITSLGVGLGLLLIWITGLTYLDPVVAILVALLIFWESYKLLMRAFNPLLDVSWEEEELEQLYSRLNGMNINYSNLRTRKSGNYRFLEFTMTMPENLTLQEISERTRNIEQDIHPHFENLSVTIKTIPGK
jgi:cation diffusion facilitator family transporter